MIVDIDKKNNNYKLMNILQLKWILYNLTLKKIYKMILIKNMIQTIIKLFIFHLNILLYLFFKVRIYNIHFNCNIFISL